MGHVRGECKAKQESGTQQHACRVGQGLDGHQRLQRRILLEHVLGSVSDGPNARGPPTLATFWYTFISASRPKAEMKGLVIPR